MNRLAFAPCSALISADSNEIQLLPSGKFKSIDGRPSDTGNWVMNADHAKKIMADLAGKEVLIDYEHQTLNAAINGQKNPAAGWFSGDNLEWREGVGLFAKNVQWTEAALSHINAKEYRYISPYIGYESDGSVSKIWHVALTNWPAIDGMNPLVAALSAFNHQQGVQMNIKELLSLPADATEQDIANAIISLKESATQSAALSASTQLTISTLQGQVSALSAKLEQNEKQALIEDGLRAGKLVTATAALAAQWPLATLRDFIAAQPGNAALGGQQQLGDQPVPARDSDSWSTFKTKFGVNKNA